MCHETTSRPPLPPIAGGAGPASTADLILEAADGNRFMAFSATTTVPGAPGLMILPDVRGLHPFYRDLAVRFAEIGVNATAMDYFGRTTGIQEHPEDFDYMAHVAQITPDGISADTTATIEHLQSEGGGGATRLYCVGFCMGGRISFNQARRDHGLNGVIGFYGGPQGRSPEDETAPVRLAPQYKIPVLGLFGGADTGIPPEAIHQFAATLDEAGVSNEMVIYPDAPHSFFDRSFDAHREACDDAWTRVLRFMDVGPA
jgi:carboxymethylenebutenolidase